jgi:hypothetical protein
MTSPPYQFHENLTSVSQVISGGQTGDLINLLSFLESRLKIEHIYSPTLLTLFNYNAIILNQLVKKLLS